MKRKASGRELHCCLAFGRITHAGLPMLGWAGNDPLSSRHSRQPWSGPFGGDALRPLTSACSHLFKRKRRYESASGLRNRSFLQPELLGIFPLLQFPPFLS